MNRNDELTAEIHSPETLLSESISLIRYARKLAAKQVNLVQLLTYWCLGRWIVEEEQKGEKRAQYGQQVIKALSQGLTEEFGRGFSKANMEFARRFYLTYQDRITETVFRQFAVEKSGAVFRELSENPPFIVSWSHYIQLMRIQNPEERSFEEGGAVR